MSIPHLNIKLYAAPATKIDFAQVIVVFHRWIQVNALDKETLIDVADYSHVPGGPGVILVGHDAFYSLEYGPEQRLGLLYNRRTRVDGDNQQNIISALQWLLKAKELLESEASWPEKSKLLFPIQELKFMVNDRSFGQDKPISLPEIQHDIQVACQQALGLGDLEFICDPVGQDKRERFAVLVRRVASGGK